VLDCQVTFKNIKTAEKALDQARENFRITNLQYQQQAATSTDVLDANSFLTQADTNYYSAVYSYLDANAALERAIGKQP
jgi:outer membrane protein TolC